MLVLASMGQGFFLSNVPARRHSADISTVESHIHLLIRRVAQAKPRDMDVKPRSVLTNVAVVVQ